MGVGVLDQPNEFGGRNHATAKSNHDFVFGEVLCGKESLALDARVLHDDTGMNPEGRWYVASHPDIVPKAGVRGTLRIAITAHLRWPGQGLRKPFRCAPFLIRDVYFDHRGSAPPTGRSRVRRPSPDGGTTNFVTMLRRISSAGFAAPVLLAVLLGTCSTSGASNVVSRPLALSDLPAGFKVIGVPLLRNPCSEIYIPRDATNHGVIGFRSPTMAIEEAVTLEKRAHAIYEELDHRYTACRSFRSSNRAEGSPSGTGTKLPLPRVGEQSQAFLFHLKVNGYRINDVVVLFREHFACGVIAFISTDNLNPQSVDLVSSLAASKAYSYSS